MKYMKELYENSYCLIVDKRVEVVANKLSNVQFDYQVFESELSLLKYIINNKKNCKVVTHGNLFKFLFMHKLAFLLFKLKKIELYWVCWGAGLNSQENRFKDFVFLIIKKIIYSGLNGINALMKPDRDKLLKIGVNSNNISLIPYSIELAESDFNTTISDKKSVVIGNQNSKHHNHESILELLHQREDNAEIEVHLFMSYGSSDANYIIQVKKLAELFFPSRAFIYKEVMSQEEYDTILYKSDAIVIDTKHQTGLAMIYKSVNNGKKVFLNSNGANKEWLNYMGIKSFPTNELSVGDLTLDIKTSLINKEKLRLFFNEITIRKNWRKFLSIE
ncbi:hypothetical protein BOO36_14855 [Vibrio navarrensis]|nr:hypothetical protein [Vibrio navarrensis]